MPDAEPRLIVATIPNIVVALLRAGGSASRVLPRAKPVFGDPLIADGSQVRRAPAPAPRRDESDDGADDGQTSDDPRSIHKPSLPCSTIAPGGTAMVS